MNNEDLQVQFKVIGIFGAPRNTSTLGTYNCIRDAQRMVDTWPDDPQFKYTQFVEMKIVKHSQVTVQTSKGLSEVKQTSKGLSEVNKYLPDSSYLSPVAERRRNATNNAYVDYERVGVAPIQVDQLDAEMRHEVSGLRREIESLRSDAQDLRNLCASLRADLSVVETDTIPFLEERFVGLRHELLNDVEDIDEVVEDLGNEVQTLRREMESLRGEEES